MHVHTYIQLIYIDRVAIDFKRELALLAKKIYFNFNVSNNYYIKLMISHGF